MGRGLLAALALLLLAPAPAAAQARRFAIDVFRVTLTVHPDASLVIREDITFEFRGAHNGIFRTIPVRYERGGLEFALRLDGIGVYDEADRPLRSEVTWPGRYVKIKAWVPGAVDTKKAVTIVYRVRRGLLDFEDHDELYWNVTGNEWEVPIRVAEAFVDLPPSVPSDQVRTLAFTGPRGGVGQDFTLEHIERYLRFSTTRALRPREGLTIVVGWPPGHVAGPSALRQAFWVVGDNWPLGLPLLAFLWGGLVWWAYGRDPAAGRSVKPEYEPPAGLGPAQAGALVDERAEPRDVIATIVDLGVRGYLEIEPVGDDGSDFVFRRLKPVLGDPDLTPIELVVLATIFGRDWVANQRLLSEVKRDYDNVFPKVRGQIYKSMVQDGLFPASPHLVRRGWALAGGLVAASAFFVSDLLPSWLGVYGWMVPVGVGASGVIFVLWARFMSKRTLAGVKMLAHVRGFQEFLERAEKDRLARMPADTLHRYLPWALALGVSERWVHGFEGMRVAEPTWYRGHGGFSLGGFERDLTAFSRGTEAAILTTRRGDGGGFGGGSGGGGGGGAPGGGGGGGGEGAG